MKINKQINFINLNKLFFILIFYLSNKTQSLITRKQDNNFILNLEQSKNNNYIGNIFIGSSQQPLKLTFSTMVSDNIIFSEKFSYFQNEKKYYSSNFSQTFEDYKQNYTIEVIKKIKNKFFLFLELPWDF